MKSFFRLSTLTICAIALTLNQGCSKNDEKPEKELIVKTARISNILMKSAVCGGEITSKGISDIFESGVVVSTSPNTAFNKIGTSALPNTSEANPFSMRLINEGQIRNTAYVLMPKTTVAYFTGIKKYFRDSKKVSLVNIIPKQLNYETFIC